MVAIKYNDYIEFKISNRYKEYSIRIVVNIKVGINTKTEIHISKSYYFNRYRLLNISIYIIHLQLLKSSHQLQKSITDIKNIATY